MKTRIKNYLEKHLVIKQFLLNLWFHPYSARTRWWARFFVYPFIIKRGKGSIIRRNARLDLNFSNKFKLGNRSIIEEYTIINNGCGDIQIGDNSNINSRAMIVGPVKIGNYVMFGSNSRITGLTHNYEDISIPIKLQGVSSKISEIEDDVWIGGNCVIIQGIKIGKHSLVAAGSVVTKDVEPYTIVAGNPARPIKKYDFDTRTWIKIL